MADSVSQKEFFGSAQMHYVASMSALGETQKDIFHDSHAEMMGDVMYLHQALKQPDVPKFVRAVVQEINGHMENKH
jgi:hypothetical protein